MRHKPWIAAMLLTASSLAIAGPADYVYTPAVEYGEKEIDFKFGTGRQGDAARESAASIGFGYGAKEWWFTEFYVKYKSDNFETTRYDALEWENKFQLTEPGQYPVDLGLILEMERPTDRTEGWEVKWGPLLQTDFGKWQLNGNLLFERNYRADTPSATVLQYQWQVKYRWQPMVELGFQGFGEVGQWDDWLPSDQRDHKLGPAIFGKLPVGGSQAGARPTAIKYNVAWLFGASQVAHDHTLRLQVEYEF